MRQNRTFIITVIAVFAGIMLISFVLAYYHYPAVFLKYIDLAVFAVFIGLSVLCIVRHIRGSVLILVCWCTLSATNVILRLYPFTPEGYISFVSYGLPIAETVCALLTGLWLIRLQKGKERV